MSHVSSVSTTVPAVNFPVWRWFQAFGAFCRRAREEWPHIRKDGSVHVLARALGVAALLGVILVLALAAQPDEPLRTEKPARAARSASAARFLSLANKTGDFPLDSDFAPEQAAVASLRRLGRRVEPEVAATLRFGAVKVPRSIVENVVQAAKSTDMDPALLMAIADKESSFAPTAKAGTSSASGLFQFVEKTWLKAVQAFGLRYGQEDAVKAIQGGEQPRVAAQKRSEILKLRNDPFLSAALAAEMLKRDGAKIAEKVGRSLTAGETYLIHFLGPEDAGRFIEKLHQTPNASAAQLLPKPARANKPIFYAKQGRKLKDRSLSEVHEAFEHMMGSRASRYQDVEAKLPAGVAAYAGQ